MNYKDFILVLNRLVNGDNNNISIIKEDSVFLEEKLTLDGEVISSNINSKIVQLFKDLKIEPDYDLILGAFQHVELQNDANILNIKKLYHYLQDENVLNATVIENNDGIHFEDFERLLLSEIPNSKVSDDMRLLVNITRENLLNGLCNIEEIIKKDYGRTTFLNNYSAFVYEDLSKRLIKEVELDILWLEAFRNYKTATLDVQNEPELIPNSPKM